MKRAIAWVVVVSSFAGFVGFTAWLVWMIPFGWIVPAIPMTFFLSVALEWVVTEVVKSIRG